jgi:hypothetical protein
MNYKIVFRKRANDHLLEIHEWYETQKEGLGDEFFLSVEATLFSIQRNPLLFHLRFKKTRCATVSKFPYGIYYNIEGDKIVVLSFSILSATQSTLRIPDRLPVLTAISRS